MKNKIGLMEVKQALRDARFREALGDDFKQDIQKYMSNPGCSCNNKIYKRVLKDAQSQLKEYYPNRELVSVNNEIKKLSENDWSVINCSVDDLEEELRKLPPGKKQLAVARYEDQVTVVVNEIDIIY